MPSPGGRPARPGDDPAPRRLRLQVAGRICGRPQPCGAPNAPPIDRNWPLTSGPCRHLAVIADIYRFPRMLSAAAAASSPRTTQHTTPHHSAPQRSALQHTAPHHEPGGEHDRSRRRHRAGYQVVTREAVHSQRSPYRLRSAPGCRPAIPAAAARCRSGAVASPPRRTGPPARPRRRRPSPAAGRPNGPVRHRKRPRAASVASVAGSSVTRQSVRRAPAPRLIGAVRTARHDVRRTPPSPREEPTR